MVHAEATFTRKFSAAHRIATDSGVCQRIHGHNYKVEITVRRIPIGGERVSTDGFVVPADLIKGIVDKKYDHKLLLDKDDKLILDLLRSTIAGSDWLVPTPGPPSTENLARWICDDVVDLMTHATGTICTVTVKVYETDTIMATAQGQT